MVKISTFRDYPFSTNVSSFRDCFRQADMRPRRQLAGSIHSPAILQITLSSAKLRLLYTVTECLRVLRIESLLQSRSFMLKKWYFIKKRLLRSLCNGGYFIYFSADKGFRCSSPFYRDTTAVHNTESYVISGFRLVVDEHCGLFWDLAAS